MHDNKLISVTDIYILYIISNYQRKILDLLKS